MNNATLQLASDASKMLMLLGRGIIGQAHVNRLRARLDDAVYRLVRLGQMKAASPEKLQLELFFQNMHTVLVSEMALLNAEALVNKKVGHNFKGALANNLVDVGQVKTIVSRLLMVSEARTPGFDKANTGANVAEARGTMLHIFGSIVRNDEWMSLLLTLGTQNAVKLNTILMQEYSSAQGREERAAKVASLVSEMKTMGSKVSLEVLTISAALTPKVAVQHAKVAPLFSTLMVDPSNSDAVNKLLAEATRVQEVALADVAEFVQARLNTLVKGLMLQKKVHEAETKAKREAVERKREDDAVAALQGMGSHLAILASNPALLKRALEAAGLAAKKPKVVTAKGKTSGVVSRRKA